MKERAIVILRFILVLSFCLACGCSTTVTSDLNPAQVEKLPVEARKVSFSSIEIVDARPAEELQPLATKIRYLIPALFWIQWFEEGNSVSPPDLAPTDMTGSFEQTLRRTLAENKMSDEDKDGCKKLALKVEITHLYKTVHASSFGLFVVSGGMFSARTFEPFVFAAARVTVADEDGRVIGSRYVSGTYEPPHELFLNCLAAQGAIAQEAAPTDGAEACAAGKLAGNIVKAVEPMLADWPLMRPPPAEKRGSFTVARVTADRLYLERATINYQDGQILFSAVYKHWMEPFAAVNEWVVDPYQGAVGCCPVLSIPTSSSICPRSITWPS